MAVKSKIEWTESTRNPVPGCTKVSPGCKFCYADRMANRLQLMGQVNYRHGFQLTLQPHMLDLPLRWKSPQRCTGAAEAPGVAYLQKPFAPNLLARRVRALLDERT